jgi:flagellar L-ring protein precursor FlgH
MIIRTRTHQTIVRSLAGLALLSIGATAGLDLMARAEAPSASLMTQTVRNATPFDPEDDPHTLRDASMFVVAPEQPRSFRKHDLVQIIVRETSRAESSQELESDKSFDIDGKIAAWPHLDLTDILNLQLYAGRTVNLPEVRIDLSKGFEGEGDYKREDDFTARLTAEVIDLLPNGHLVLEARTFIKNDEEETTIKVTGVCRPSDVTAANTVLSNQIHDLCIMKTNRGELKKANEKGIISKVFDTLFAF